MTTIETRWWWIRHAPVIGGERIYGQRDLPADTSDDAHFAALAALLPPDAVLVTSDLQRTVQTAAAIASAGLSLPDPIQDPELREQHFGDWQGVLRHEFAQQREPDFGQFWIVPAAEQAPNGESFLDLVARVQSAVDRLTDTHAGQDIVCVAHGGTIRAALAKALGIDPTTALSFTTHNSSLTRLDHLRHPSGSEAWRVHMVNWTPS